MRNLFLILLLFKTVTVFSQEDTNCSFDDIAKYENLINTESDVSYEILKDERSIEYFYEGEQLSRNITSGRIIKINDERAIDIFNKFSISLYNIIDILDIKVRTIQKDGNIIELDKSNIKEVENLDEEGSYKIFAIDGIEIGSIVEINYKTKNYPRLYGSYYFQGSGKTNNVLFKLVSPKHLKFDAKSYNSQFLKEDTVIGDKRYLTLKCDEIDPLDDTESYSFPDANKVRVEYSYRKNVEYHTTDYYSYNLATQNIYSTLYQIDNKEIKAIEKLILKIKLNSLELEDKILAVEKYLKENFIIAPIDHIEDGINITDSFEKAELFPPLILRMIRVGENTGELDEALNNVSYFYNREVQEGIDKIEPTINPIMTIIMAVLLGWVMMSVLGPIWDAIATVG